MSSLRNEKNAMSTSITVRSAFAISIICYKVIAARTIYASFASKIWKQERIKIWTSKQSVRTHVQQQPTVNSNLVTCLQTLNSRDILIPSAWASFQTILLEVTKRACLVALGGRCQVQVAPSLVVSNGTWITRHSRQLLLNQQSTWGEAGIKWAIQIKKVLIRQRDKELSESVATSNRLDMKKEHLLSLPFLLELKARTADLRSQVSELLTKSKEVWELEGFNVPEWPALRIPLTGWVISM